MVQRNKRYRELETVVSQRSEIIAEEFPEGPYGAPFNEEHLGKTTPWEGGMHAAPQFTYENRTFHAGLEREHPDAHPTHSEAEEV
ncbi:MAG: hypothetical protein BAA01_06800 [Bacillus thermozeamaize]|uniref:Cytosolic protein n=1 Tax=Bacillus thermozeamaize TaxID=230954 RepID=A0A1Y3PQ77_9BACI|nr:MAG: hypothetical protein BAA01_06800 [Bacillus thermozeamaize]